MSFAQRFELFYQQEFLREHRHPANIAMHVLGTVLSAAFLGWVLTQSFWWAALLYPLIHGLPGLAGHRLFERSAALGDLRIDRKDFPLWWFILANHRLCWDLVAGKWAQRERL